MASLQRIKKRRAQPRINKNIPPADSLALAIRHHQNGQLLRALQLYQNVLRLDPDNFEALNNAGNVLNNQKEYSKALRLLHRAVQVLPDSPDAHYNLANSLSGLKKYNEAITEFQKAICANPNYAEAYNNLGNTFTENGEFQEGIISYQQALKLNPCLAVAAYNLGNALVNLQNRFAEALDHYRKAVAAKPDYLEPVTCLAIYAWIHGDSQALSKHLQKLVGARGNDKFARPYHLFLSRLVNYRALHPEEYRLENDLPVLYAMGDSHCLASAHTKVHFKNVAYRVEPRIIIGCKAWHLANDTSNKFKYWFESQVGNLPENALAVLMFGEIDCRIDEGIIRNFKKTANNLEESVADLVRNYLDYILGILQQRNIFPIIHGVPAPVIKRGEMSSSDQGLLVKVVRIFNQNLQRETTRRNLVFSDVFAYTCDQNLQSSGKHYIDKRHLLPPVLGHLLGEAGRST